jgi:hypothetical protein
MVPISSTDGRFWRASRPAAFRPDTCRSTFRRPAPIDGAGTARPGGLQTFRARLLHIDLVNRLDDPRLFQSDWRSGAVGDVHDHPITAVLALARPVGNKSRLGPRIWLWLVRGAKLLRARTVENSSRYRRVLVAPSGSHCALLDQRSRVALKERTMEATIFIACCNLVLASCASPNHRSVLHRRARPR